MTNIIEATPMAHKLRKYQKEAVYRVINGDGKNQMIRERDSRYVIDRPGLLTDKSKLKIV